MKEPSGDLFSDIVEKNIEVYKNAKDSQAKKEAFKITVADAFSQYGSILSSISEEEYTQFFLKIRKQIEEIVSEVREEAFRKEAIRNKPRFDDFAILLVLPMVGDKDLQEPSVQAFSNLVDKMRKEPELLLRAYLLEFFAKWLYQAKLMRGDFVGNTVRDLEEIVEDSLGIDSNWFLSTSILALHENLVKKKLIDLGVNEAAIRKIEKDSRFAGLVEHLVQQVREKEGRELGVTFHRTSSLREIRNRLEHHGYQHSVTKNEVIDLLNDIKKLNDELFLNNRAAVKK